MPLRAAVPIVLVTIACASRSALPAPAADDAAANGRDAEPFDREVSIDGGACAERPAVCAGGGDFGQQDNLARVLDLCTRETGARCGELALVFDGEGCLSRLSSIVDWPPGFVECVEREVIRDRWLCGRGRTIPLSEPCR
jgi:hypothetical protein